MQMWTRSLAVVRLREKYSDEELARIYATPHDSSRWEDHNIRVAETIRFIVKHFYINEQTTVADLSAGDARIIRGLGIDDERLYIGDFAPGYAFQGPISDTIHQIPPVDLFILSETLEHLDDPVSVLKLIREKTMALVLTTPHAKWDDNNPEHYWAWDQDGIAELLNEAGFQTGKCEIIELAQEYYYDFQVWIAQ